MLGVCSYRLCGLLKASGLGTFPSTSVTRLVCARFTKQHLSSGLLKTSMLARMSIVFTAKAWTPHGRHGESAQTGSGVKTIRSTNMWMPEKVPVTAQDL